MYTIRQAAARSGVAISTIRAWERRYRAVDPARTASGYRLYDEAAIERLVAMRRLVEDGWQPSVAAVALRGPWGTALASTTTARPPAGSPPPGSRAEDRAGSRTRDPLVTRFVEAAGQLDADEVSSVLDELFARGTFEHVAEQLLFPALEALGDAWAAGSVSVAAEHLASNAVLRRLGQALEAAGAPSGRRRRVVIGLPPASRHELGALAFAVAARRAGVPVAYVGADLPIDDWRTASRDARAMVIGVPTVSDAPAAAELAQELLATSPPGLVVALGGRATPEVPGAIRLPPELTAGVDALRKALRRP